MDDDLTTGGPTGTGAEPRWPTALPLPALEPLDWEDLAELRAGDVESDRTEALAVMASRGRGALDLAIGDGLAALKLGVRLISLGFSGVGDYAQEVLGIQPRTAQSMARLSLELQKRPLLRAAVRSGEVRIRKAQVILAVAIGDSEAEWVELARSHTVRALEAMVRKAQRGGGEEDDRWARLHAHLAPEKRAVLDDALDLAGAILGPASTRAQRLEALAQEQLSGRPVDPEDRLAPSIRELPQPPTEADERAREQLEVETEQWSFLPRLPVLPVPEVSFNELTSAREIDAALRKLQAMQQTWDAAMGHAARAIKASGMHRILGFADFG